MWRQKWHTLSTGLPAHVRVEVWDKKQVVADERIGMVEVVLEGNTDLNVDSWFQLTRRNSKGVIVPTKSGTIRIHYNFQFSSSEHEAATTAKPLWDVGSLLMIEPVPFWNTVEIHGPIHDQQMLKFASGTPYHQERLDPLPYKQYDGKGEFVGWTFRAANQATSMTALNLQAPEEKNAWDITQTVALRVADRLAAYGFALKRSDGVHCVETGTGREKAVSLVHDRHLHSVMTNNTSAQSQSQQHHHVLVEARLTKPDAKFVIDIIGTIDKSVIEGLPAEDFELKEVIEGGHQSRRHVRWVAEVKNVSKRFSFNNADIKRKENALLPFLVKVLDHLLRRGCEYVTIVGNQHLLRYQSQPSSSSSSSSTTTTVTTALLVEPVSILGDKEIQILAQEVTADYVTSIAKTMGYTGQQQLNLAEMKDLSGKLQYYALAVPHAGGGPLRASQAGANQQENVMQNFMINVTKRVVGSGYEIIGPLGLDGLFLRRAWPQQSEDAAVKRTPLKPLTSHIASGRIALLDPCRTYGEFQIELQGALTEDEVVNLAQHNGFDQIKKRQDKNGFAIYVLPVKMPSRDSSYESLNTKTNRIQAHVMRSLTYLHNTLSFCPLTQWGDDNILLQHNPNRQPGTFILVDVSPTVHHISIEFQGDIDLAHVKQVAAHANLPNPDKLTQGKDEYHIGWRIKSDVQRMALWIGAHQSERKRTKVRRLKTQWAKVVDGLSLLGWTYLYVSPPLLPFS
jgi:hypothetical protein